MVKAVFVDFYGTLVHDDNKVIARISQKIFDTGKAKNQSEIGVYWWNEFQTASISAYGDCFAMQRELEYQTLNNTLRWFHSSEDAASLLHMVFEHWVEPPVFDETKLFFERCPVPIYLVTNIDRCDVQKAVAFHALRPAGIFTSEDARAYKPRKELFELALDRTGLSAEQVVHIGDSLSCDINGASAAGIRAIWVNRAGEQVPEGVCSVRNLLEVFDTDFFE